MSSLAPLKRDFPTNTQPGYPGLVPWFRRVFVSTVGSKYVMAITGLGLTGFVIIHMLGNLQIFGGQNALNTYAQALKDFGPLLWVARAALLTIFLLHVIWAFRLVFRSSHARPVKYVCKETVQATFASRTMIQTGILILLFLLYHIAHFTLGWVKYAPLPTGQDVSYMELRDDLGRMDVYNMMVFGFRDPLISIFYLVAQVGLLLHLSHGIQSTFQSIGISGPRWNFALRTLGWALAIVVVGGNFLIVISVWAGWVPHAPIYVPSKGIYIP